ncbi:hypothetical protein HK405_014347, partial [Cladochytrium tenue]
MTLSAARAVPNIVVVGGAFAGTAVADSLLRTLGARANVLLVDERDAFFFAVRALVPLAEAPARDVDVVWRPFAEFVPALPPANLLRGRAASLAADRLELADGRVVPFDYAVVTTGTFSPPPGKPLQMDRPGYEAALDELWGALGAASEAVVVGGGQVGVELACHLCSRLPHLRVTLLHRSDSLLSSMAGVSPAFRAAVLDHARRLFPNLRVELSQRVLESPAIPDPRAGYSLRPQVLTTSGGLTLRPDVTFLTTGNVPNSDFVAAGLGPQVLDAKGYIKTDPTGQVAGFPNVFAAGDVATLDDLKLAKMARAQADVVVHNIVSRVDPSAVAETAYYEP